MSKSSSTKVLHPANPILIKDKNIPKENGHTRVLPDGSLLYREPASNEELPAVRLQNIRSRLVHEASTRKTYRFPKKRGYEDTNVTAFVKKDYNYGSKRENRSDRLFQIQTDGTKHEKPNGYVMDGDRIILDAFDHGLRNFGNQLPLYVSSELEGHDIEDYLRRNREISVYDLIARAPNGYYLGPPSTTSETDKSPEKPLKWHAGPPRVGTFSMRATRFRLHAGCLSWEKKDGTVAKNQRILDVIPARYKDPAVNSTRGWRDLNKAEMKKIQDGAMRKPQQGPKRKRAAQAGKDRESKETEIDQPAERADILRDGGEMQYGEEDAWTGHPVERDSGAWPHIDPQDFNDFIPAPQPYQVNTEESNVWRPSSILDGRPMDISYEPPQQASYKHLKRSRSAFDFDPEESIDNRAQKRMRVDSQNISNQRNFSLISTSRMQNQQRRTPAPNFYAAENKTPFSIHPAMSSSSIPAFHGHDDQVYNPLITTDSAPTIPPSTYNSIGSLFNPHQLYALLSHIPPLSFPPHSQQHESPFPYQYPPSPKRKRSPADSTDSLPPNKRPRS